MACFWVAILRRFKIPGVTNPSSLLAHLKQRNTMTPDVTWQGENLSAQQQRENFEWVRDYAPNQVNGGHFTSACDPFFCLLCQLFRVEIQHVYATVTLRYVPRTPSDPATVYTFRSNQSHMS